ncbi:MAG: TOBE domain-containing protein [Rhodococcus sp.]|nr:TOBE domain-containing protein [Rhodococcus sp. (in: high G+C Gram-positive bacteria)]
MTQTSFSRTSNAADVPPVGTVVSSIRAQLASLAPSERRVAQTCVDRPHDTAWFSAADLAAAADTSTATVVRTCQNLGFDGFQQLRMLLLRDFGAEHSAPAAEVAGDDMSLVETIIRDVAADLSGSLAPLSTDAARTAIQLVRGADRVLVVGNGGSAPAAMAFATRMLSTRRRIEAPTDAIIQQLAAGQLGDGDVLLAISDTGWNPRTVEAAEAARGRAAMTMATRIALLDGGKVEQIGTPEEVYDRPESVFVAGFLGSPPMNLLDARLRGDDRIIVSAEGIRAQLWQGRVDEREVVLGVRPEHLRLAESTDDVTFDVRVDLVENLGSEEIAHCLVGDSALAVRGRRPTGLLAGERVILAADPQHVHLFDKASGRRLEWIPDSVPANVLTDA